MKVNVVNNNYHEGDYTMRTTLNSIMAVVVLVALAGSTALAGGDNRVGTAGADQLLIPVGARGIALGSSYMAGISGLNALYYNPAGLSASSARAEAMFSHMNTVGDLGADYFAVGSNFAGFGNLALSVRSLAFGDILVTDERNPDGTGATYSPSFITVGLTYSRALTDRIRAGVSAYLVSETIDRASASGTSFDIGIQYQGLAGYRGLQLGVTLRHLGGSMKYEGPGLYRLANDENGKRGDQLLKIDAAGFNMPTSLELGLAYTAMFTDMHSLTVSSSFENNNFLTDQFRIGAEYSYKNFFFLRGSFNMAGQNPEVVFANSTSDGSNNYLYGPAFGAGINYSAGDLTLGIDYAYRVNDIFDGSHVFSLNVGF